VSSRGGWLLRLIGAEGVEGALWPPLLVAFLYAVFFGTFWSYVGIWAVDSLGASGSAVGLMFLLTGVGFAVGGYVGGQLSDRYGRKPLVLFGLGAESVIAFLLAAVGRQVTLGFALVIVAGAFGMPAYAAVSALVADLVPEPRQESAFASLRVAQNSGVFLGPPLGGLLLVGDSWPRFLVAVAVLGLVATAVAARLLPAAPPRIDEVSAAEALGLIGRDTAFVLLLAATVTGLAIGAYETVLPVVAVSSLSLAPPIWGLLASINPLLVTLFQLRLTQTVEPVPAAVKVASGVIVMGFSFLLLLVDGGVAMIALVLVVFVVGEMLWLPTVQALAARSAPERLRGAYLGAFGGSLTIAWTTAPLIGLQARAVGGDAAAWAVIAAASVLSALIGLAACRAARPASPASGAPARPRSLWPRSRVSAGGKR